jgi:3-oxoacyl-[acyl-carrier protein] reductase
MTFTNQVAIITGAGEGIGYEIARQLSLKGAAVILNDINTERAKQAAEICAEGELHWHRRRCCRADAVNGLVAGCCRIGRVDIAVANAGISFYDDFLRLPLKISIAWFRSISAGRFSLELRPGDARPEAAGAYSCLPFWAVRRPQSDGLT